MIARIMAVLALALGLALVEVPGSRLAAETVTDLYAAEVTAPDRSEQALDRAAREALEQVLVKVSGSSVVLGNAAIAPSLRRARTYVQRYAYRPLPADEEGVGVWFQFSGSDVTDLVTAAGAPVWTANRPVVLSWLAVDGAREPDGEDAPRIVGQGAEAEIAQALSSAFSRRGVPNRLPGASAALPADRLAQASTDALLRASEPYGLDDVLFGRLSYDAEGQASGRWSYFYEGERRDRAVSPGSEQEFMDAGVNLAADAMAQRLAVAPTVGEASGLLVSIVGVGRYADYAAVVKWFEQLELVEQANLVHVVDDQIELRLIAQVDAEQLAGLIAMNPRLLPLAGAADGGQLSYQWQN